jgi:hypothetical protein
MRKIEGQIVNSSPELILNYQKLKELNQTVLELSGQLWNWPICNTLTTPTISRILHLNNLYQKILKVPGNICEFGIHYGSSSSILINLKQIYEPRNSNRRFFLFDTFEGFRGVDPKDGSNVQNGDFVIDKKYDEILSEILHIQAAINRVEDPKEFEIFSGDASRTIDEFLDSSPEAGIAMAIFDMDLYQPTSEVLKKVIPRLTKGALVVFDEFNHPQYPGESIAVREVLGTHNIALERSNFLPHAAWFQW